MPRSERQPDFDNQACRNRWNFEVSYAANRSDRPVEDLERLLSKLDNQQEAREDWPYYNDVRWRMAEALLKHDRPGLAFDAHGGIDDPRQVIRSWESFSEYGYMSPDEVVKGGVRLALEQDDPFEEMVTWERLVTFCQARTDSNTLAEIQVYCNDSRQRWQELGAVRKAGR